MRQRLFLFLTGVVVVIAGLSLYLAFGGRSVAQVPQLSDAKIILYWEPNFRGPALEVTGTLADMPVTTDENGAEFDWNDQVRSIEVISGTWRLHQNGRCNTRLDETPLEELDVKTKEPIEGWSSLVSATSEAPLSFPNCAAGGFAHDISSIELVSEENLPAWAFITD